MRIFYASDSTPNADIVSNLWRNNLFLPLVDLGHDIVEFTYDWQRIFQNLDPNVPSQKVFIDENRPVTSAELLRQVRAAHESKPLDLFFSYLYDACVSAETIDEIKSLGIVTVNWYCNGSYQLNLVKGISPHYDYCLVPERFRIADYISMGATPIYCQEAANPAIYKPYDLPQEFDVTFVGQAYGDRPQIVRYLLDQNIDIRVWGTKWRSYGPQSFARQTVRSVRGVFDPSRRNIPMLPETVFGGPLTDLAMVEMYSRSKINIGFSSCGETHRGEERILQVRLRDFEVPMSGGFYMVEQMDELAEFFEIGKEVVCYVGKEDLADKIKYYLKHDSEREKIRQAGHERALRDHSWHKRFRDSFQAMGLNGNQ